ncbi:MAG: hypothetical protein Q8L36_02640 [bacterium]|nr:hypothetical protein [bacterium]
MTTQIVEDSKKMTDEQLGKLARRQDEIKRRLNEGTLDYDGVMASLQFVIEGGTISRESSEDLVESEPILESPLLAAVTTLTIPALPKFDANKFFTSGVFRRKQSKVKFWGFGDNFKSKFFNKVEGPTAELKIQMAKLNRSSKDSPIIKALGNDKAKIKLTLGQFAWLLEQQPDGKSGTLLINGWWNIFYIEDDEGTLWAVCADWYAGYGWHVAADAFGNPSEWDGDYLVFSQLLEVPQDLSVQEV